MTKKILMLITFFTIIVGTSKVLAINSKEENINEKMLDNLVEIKINETWQEEVITKYTKEKKEIYKIGEYTEKVNEIQTETSYYDVRLLRILKNKKLQNSDDNYMANQIAIDFVMKEKNLEEFDFIYRINEDLLEENKILRSRAILEEAKRLIGIGLNGEETYEESIELCKIGEFEKDLINPDYTSQAFDISCRGAQLLWYKTKKVKAPIDYFFADYETGEAKEEFRAENEKFKIMIPNELAEDTFEIELEAEIHFLKEELFEISVGGKRYIMLSEGEEVKEYKKFFDNRFSSISIYFEDKETKQMLAGGIIEVDGNEIQLNEPTGINMSYLPKGDLVIKIKKVPDKYLLEEDTYIAHINYKENYIANIGVLHENGRIKLTSNVKSGRYEIYNKQIGYIGEYEMTDGVLLATLSTGDYFIRQISIEDGYKLSAKEIDFTVEVNKLTELEAIYEEEENKEEKPPEEEPEKNEVEKEEAKDNVNIKVDISIENIEEEIAKEEKTDNEKDTKEIEEVSNKKERMFLPRTGKDYFVFKIVLADLCIFLIFIVLGLIKRQTTRFKQSAKPSVKE